MMMLSLAGDQIEIALPQSEIGLAQTRLIQHAILRQIRIDRGRPKEINFDQSRRRPAACGRSGWIEDEA